MRPSTLDPAAIDFARPGKHHYRAAFHLDGSWGYSLVPITVINGLRQSSRHVTGVAVFAGTHGNEYEGQIAVKRLCRDLDPAEMSGRVILMPQLSERACAAHTRSAPDDGVNMNRAFPGDARGTLSKRIAHFVTQRVFPHAGIVIDLHAGGREASFPICTSLHPIADPVRQAETIAIAGLFDTPFVYLYARSMASGGTAICTSPNATATWCARWKRVRDASPRSRAPARPASAVTAARPLRRNCAARTASRSTLVDACTSATSATIAFAR